MKLLLNATFFLKYNKTILNGRLVLAGLFLVGQLVSQHDEWRPAKEGVKTSLKPDPLTSNDQLRLVSAGFSAGTANFQ